MADRDERRWAEAWRRAGPVLEGRRREALSRLDTVVAVAALSDAFDLAARRAHPRRTSGLVEQQRWFVQLRRM